MTVSGSARARRAAPEKKPKKGLGCYPVLLSCLLFLIVLCTCLVAALVLIGRHMYQSSALRHHEEGAPRKPQPLLARLPNDTIPLRYDLTMMPNLKKSDFKGVVNITINLTRTRRNVILHSKKLSIDEAELFFVNDTKEIAVENVQENEEDEVIVVVPGEELLPGVYHLTLKFSGSLLNRTTGFYRSSYKNLDTNETRYIATSKFEPTYARQAFPCFDEPQLKAKYDVHILKPKDDPDYIALSNMPQMGEPTELPEGTLVHFQPSVKMSTYLTCFIVCDFKFQNTQFVNDDGSEGTPEKIDLRVYSTPAQVKKTEFALEVAKKVIEYFLQYFQIKYPLPKLDLIAIPDFVSGAMEHWGLVTFRETRLLYDEATTSTATKQGIAGVISHELAHSWFGNLVTMNWWNDLWLNEGFASYIQYKGVHAYDKEWQMLDQFLIDTLHGVLSLDATPAAHPIVQTVVTPDQITEIFDSITYSKGASVLRMLEGAITEKKFQNGVTKYLQKHEWGNAKTQDLWDKLQEQIEEGDDLNITTFMDTWTRQMGYPILDIEVKGDSYVLTQKRFLKDSKNPGNVESEFGYKWTIPVTYITDQNQTTTQTKWFDFTKNSITIPKPSDAKWIKFNHKQVGYYRVNYPKDMWDNLASNIKEFESVSDKTHLLEEAFSIAESSDGLLDYDVPLSLTKYLVDEENYIPWSVASSKLLQIRKYLAGSLEYSAYMEYIQKIVKPTYDKLTWIESTEDSHLKRRARITVLNLACTVGLEDCKQKAKDAFAAWLGGGKDPSQDLRSIVYKFGMEESGATEWHQLLQIYKDEIDANEKLILMNGLAHVKEPWLLRRLIELGKDEQIIRSQDYFTMLQYISANPTGTPIVWDYVRENWLDLVERFGLNDRYLGRLIPSITGTFITQTKLKEMEVFFETYPNAGAGAAARQEALANVRNNIKWVEQNKKTVEKWIKDNANTFEA